MQTRTAYIALGANLGDRAANIVAALDALRATPETRVVRTSNLIENPAVGGPPDAPPFLNGVAEVETTLTPRDLLDRLLEIERSLGRERRQKWEPRPIDLDLILYEDRVIDTPELQLPHPLMQERRFVLEPLAELAPDRVHPVSELTVREMLNDLDESEGFPAAPASSTGASAASAAGTTCAAFPRATCCPECGRPTSDSINPERFEPPKPVEGDDPFAGDVRLVRSHVVGIARECGCAQQAVLLVLDAIAFANSDTSGQRTARHVDARALVASLELLALDLFNGDEKRAAATLEAWGIKRSEDVGRIMTALIGARRLVPSEQDRADDFNGLFEPGTLFPDLTTRRQCETCAVRL